MSLARWVFPSLVGEGAGTCAPPTLNRVRPVPAQEGAQENPWLVRGLAVLFLAFALERLTSSTPDTDLWGYLAFGRLYWDTGRFPYQDVFAYLPTLKPWVYHEWLTGVLFYPLYRTLGAPGLQVLKYALGLGAAGLVYLTARRRGAEPLAALVALIVVQTFLTLGYSPVRAQAFTFAFFALTLYLLETARQTGCWRGLWLLLPLQVLWANLHGGFLAGLGLCAIYALGEALARRPFLPYIAVLFFSGLATLLNPYGWQYWRYLAAAISLPRPEIGEWVSAYQGLRHSMFSNEFLLFFVVLLFSLFMILRTRWRELTPLLALAFTLYLGLMHLRHQVFFYLAVAAYLPTPLTAYLQIMRADPRIHRLGRRLGWKIPTLAAALVVGYYGYLIGSQRPLSFELPSRPAPRAKSPTYYPTGALAYIREHRLSGSVLANFDWGEYLIWELYPQCRVSLDGRFETVYPPGVCREYFDFLFARPGWRDFLKKYPPRMVLVDSRAAISASLAAETSWRLVYQDEGAALFLPDNRAGLAGQVRP